jgi:hypothetical protein
MKLFFAVLFCMLAVGFISFMTLSLVQIIHKNPEAFKQPHNVDTKPSH